MQITTHPRLLSVLEGYSNDKFHRLLIMTSTDEAETEEQVHSIFSQFFDNHPNHPLVSAWKNLLVTPESVANSLSQLCFDTDSDSEILVSKLSDLTVGKRKRKLPMEWELEEVEALPYEYNSVPVINDLPLGTWNKVVTRKYGMAINKDLVSFLKAMKC